MITDPVYFAREAANSAARRALGNAWMSKPGAMVWVKPTREYTQGAKVEAFDVVVPAHCFIRRGGDRIVFQTVEEARKFNGRAALTVVNETVKTIAAHSLKRPKMWKVPAPVYWPGGKLPDGFKLVPIVPLVKADFSVFDVLMKRHVTYLDWMTPREMVA